MSTPSDGDEACLSQHHTTPPDPRLILQSSDQLHLSTLNDYSTSLRGKECVLTAVSGVASVDVVEKRKADCSRFVPPHSKAAVLLPDHTNTLLVVPTPVCSIISSTTYPTREGPTDWPGQGGWGLALTTCSGEERDMSKGQ